MEGLLTNEQVLARQVAWESYKTSGQISDRDFNLIKRLDKAPESSRTALVQEVCGPRFGAAVVCVDAANKSRCSVTDRQVVHQHIGSGVCKRWANERTDFDHA